MRMWRDAGTGKDLDRRTMIRVFDTDQRRILESSQPVSLSLCTSNEHGGSKSIRTMTLGSLCLSGKASGVKTYVFSFTQLQKSKYVFRSRKQSRRYSQVIVLTTIIFRHKISYPMSYAVDITKKSHARLS